MADKNFVYDKETGKVVLNLPDIGKTAMLILKGMWKPVKFLFWPVLLLWSLGSTMIEYPKKTKKVFVIIGAWTFGIWGGLAAMAFLICLGGPEGLPKHFTWFCFLNAYVGIAGLTYFIHTLEELDRWR